MSDNVFFGLLVPFSKMNTESKDADVGMWNVATKQSMLRRCRAGSQRCIRSYMRPDGGAVSVARVPFFLLHVKSIIKMILKLSYKGRKATWCCFKPDGSEWFNTPSVLLNVAHKQMLTQQREDCSRKHVKPQRATTHEWWSLLCVNTKEWLVLYTCLSVSFKQKWLSYYKKTFICILNTVQDVNFK